MATSIKVENKLQNIYRKANFSIECDNRSYFTKSLNKALAAENVEVRICEKGFHWTSESGFKHNVRIYIDGIGKRFNQKDFSPESLCNCFAKVAKMEHVKKSINKHSDAYMCEKCDGKGILPCFMHVCQGVCFDCLGVGYKFRRNA